MSHLKRGACALLAIVATASMQVASADIINSQHPWLTATGSTHTLIVRGGGISFVDGFDTSSVDISGGHVAHMYWNDSALVRRTSGDISHLTLNDTTLAKGDQAKVRVGSTNVVVQCLDITDTSVVLNVNKSTGRTELFLKK